MILHLNDWAHYPTAIVDLETKNTSFLRLASIFKQMGVKNNAFHLALLQPELQGVDPFSTLLTTEQKLKIALECANNPFYALREIIQLPPQGGKDPIHYISNRSNIAMTWCFFSHIDFANIQPRQTGKSGSIDSLWAIVLTLMGVNTDIQLITKDNKVRRSNVARLKGIIEYLPGYLNPTTSKDADNTESITCLVRGNHYRTAVGLAGKEAAENLGRGLTSPITHVDEVPYIPNVDISLPVALSSGTAARENVKAVDGLYGNIFTTTAGKKNTKEGRFAYNLIHNGLYWDEKLYDSPNNAVLVETILNNSTSKTPMINGTFSHRQLGKTDAWILEAIANSRSGEELANRDYFNIWGDGSQHSPIAENLHRAISNSEMEPLYVMVTRDKYLLKWYIPRDRIEDYMEQGQFFINIDSSNAVGKDSNGLTIIDSRNMSVVAAAAISEANLYKYAVWIANLLIQYKNTILMIENKSSAQGIIDVLLTILPHNGIDPFKRIYSRLIENIEQYPKEREELKIPLARRSESFYLRHKSKFGFNTNGTTREYLFSTVLQHAVNTSGHLVRDKTLSSEIRGLVERNGRIDHISGGHDDLCVSWLLGHYLASSSKNLDMYDLKHNLILSNIGENAATETDAERVNRGTQNNIKLRIEALKEELIATQSPATRMRVEYRLTQLVKELGENGDTTLSIDAIISETKEKASKRTSLRDSIKRLQSKGR